MFNNFNTSTRKRRALMAGAAALLLFAGISLQAAATSFADSGGHSSTASGKTVRGSAGAGAATLDLTQESNGNVLVTVMGMTANAPVTIYGAMGQMTGQGTFTATASGGLVVAFAPDAGATGQLTATAMSGTTVVTDTISIGSTGAKAKTVATDDEAGGDEAPAATAPAGNRAPSSNECLKFANKDSKETCQGPNDGEAGEIQAYVAELQALFKDEAGMKAAGLFLDPGSSNHYQVYASKWKREWPSGARVAHLIEEDGKIRGAQIDTSGGNPDWLKLVPNNGGGGHTHMDGKGGYWHHPH